MGNITLILVLMMCVTLLTACGGKTIVKTEYVYPVVIVPEEPPYYKVNWHKIDGSYCVDMDNAKNLLKNFYILKTYKEELKLILTDLSKGGN